MKTPTIALASLLFFAIAPASSAGVSVTTTGKTATGVNVSSGTVTITITETRKGMPGNPNPPLTAPSFELDLFDYDSISGHDAWGFDKFPTSPFVSSSGWQLGTVRGYPGEPGKVMETWTYTYTVQNFTVPAIDIFGNPDPYLYITTSGPGSGAPQWIGIPDHASAGAGDWGTDGPLLIANADFFFGYPAAAFSRGYDEISALDSGLGALYFVPEYDSEFADLPVHEGTAFVYDGGGDLWFEDVYSGEADPFTEFIAPPRYLNINTAEAGTLDPGTDDVYFVEFGDSEVRYNSFPDPFTAAPFLALPTAGAVSALAVQDLAPRGVWSAGDEVLYSVEGSAEILRLAFGGAPFPVVHDGYTFDGSIHELPLDHFEHLPDHPFVAPTGFRALSVASPLAATPETPDRIPADPVDIVPPGAYAYGCGMNPDESLVVLGGEPLLGETLILGVDNPLGTQAAGSIALVAVSLAPAGGFPCGTPIPGWGMDGVAGELLISLPAMLDPILFGGLWSGPGMPVPVALPIPDSAVLIGLPLFAQGVMYDSTIASGVEIGLAGAAEVLIGG